MTSQPSAYVAHHQGETLEDTYRRTDCGDEYGYPVPAVLVDELETAQAAADAAVAAVRRYIDEHGIQEVDLGEDPATPDDPTTHDADPPRWHLYLIHDKLTPNNVRATLDVDELPVVGDVLDLPEPGFNGEPARWKWKVSLVEPIAGHDSATVYCTDAPADANTDDDSAWAIAQCVQCGMKMPFRDTRQRDEWADRHSRSAGHDVDRFEECR